jgi:hypothetical protein
MFVFSLPPTSEEHKHVQKRSKKRNEKKPREKRKKRPTVVFSSRFLDS